MLVIWRASWADSACEVAGFVIHEPPEVILAEHDTVRRLLGAAAVAACAAALMNANGREIGSYDTQPTKYAARELAARGTLALDAVVARMPALAERSSFGQALDGHIRSSYPVLPSIIAAGPAWLLAATGAVDLESGMAPALVAKLTASLLVALSVACAFLIARARTSAGLAVLVALGYGFGTNVWLAGQTLGGHEVVALGLTAALALLTPPGQAAAGWRVWAAMAMLAVAGAARAQVAPAVAVLALWILVRGRFRPWPALSLLAAAAGLVVAYNVAWFGHPLGAVARLELLHPTMHATSGSFGSPWQGGLGLLASPSRGLLIFSPVVLVCVAGLRAIAREGWRGPLAWCLAAAVAQFALYACYSVWWGGHTYGPRYLVDMLPLLIPIAAEGAAVFARNRLSSVVAAGALAWSVALAATGAFCYPAERWNTSPDDVDVRHGRLWNWQDPQFVRCWKTGLSPQNFGLFRAAALHADDQLPPR
jgi:hypothetical protein